LARNVLLLAAMKTQTRYSERSRSPIFWAILDLNDLARSCFPERHGCGRCAPQILSALLRAATAFNDAAEGRDVGANLDRVRAALTSCESAFLILRGRLPDPIVCDAIRRIDAVYAGVRAVAALDPVEWPEVPLPQEGDYQPATDGGIWPRLREMHQLVAAVVELHLGSVRLKRERVDSKSDGEHAPVARRSRPARARRADDAA
jgi:hypothetical protein